MRKALVILGSVALLGVVFPPLASAASLPTVPLSTELTFTGPVSLPDVSLPAGTYLFRLPDLPNAPNIVQVLSEDGKTVYATESTIPIVRANASDGKTIVFKETPADRPAKIDAWFWLDGTTGSEFIYSEK